MPVSAGSDEPDDQGGQKPAAEATPRIINPGEMPNGGKNREMVAFEATMYRGPVPHPDIAAGWERVCPGGADRLLTMAEKQSDHRQKMEELVLTSSIKRSQEGLRTGFAIGVVALIVAGIVTGLGFPWVGATIGVGDLAALVGVFVYGSQGQRKEREAKDANRQAIAEGKNDPAKP